MAESPFNGMNDLSEGGWVGCDGESMEKSGSLLGGKIQLALRTIGDVDGDDTRDLFTKRLDRDCSPLEENILA